MLRVIRTRPRSEPQTEKHPPRFAREPQSKSCLTRTAQAFGDVVSAGVLLASCLAAGSCAKSPPAKNDVHPVETVLQTPFGDDPEAVGHEIPDEGLPVGPSSFVVDEDGRAFVLDQLNRRIQVYEQGTYANSIPLSSIHFDDLDLYDGGFVLLNKYADGSVVFVNDQGEEIGSAPVMGSGVEAMTSVAAVFSRDDGVWVETDSGHCVRVAGTEANADWDRPAVAGRISDDGSTVFRQEVVQKNNEVIVYRSEIPDGDTEVLAVVPFSKSIGVTEIEASPDGTVYVVAVLQDDDSMQLEVVALGGNGREQWRAQLPPPEGVEEMLRTIRLGRDGMLYSMRTTEEGLEIAKVLP